MLMTDVESEQLSRVVLVDERVVEIHAPRSTSVAIRAMILAKLPSDATCGQWKISKLVHVVVNLAEIEYRIGGCDLEGVYPVPYLELVVQDLDSLTRRDRFFDECVDQCYVELWTSDDIWCNLLIRSQWLERDPASLDDLESIR